MITREQLRKMKKIDAHSHVGKDARNPPSNIEEYRNRAEEEGIVEAMLIGVPLPCYQTQKGIYTPVNWEVDGTTLDTYSELVGPNDKPIRNSIQQNPFAESNKTLEQQVRNTSSPNLKLNFAPHVHPLYDTQKHLEETLEKKPMAVKIHGSSWGVDPKDIPHKFFDTLKKHDVPLIAHTDYNTNPKNGEHLIQRANDPLVWVKLCKEHDIRASLTHSLRLCEDSWKEIKDCGDQFIVDLSPVLTMNGYRTKQKGKDFSTELARMANIGQLVYGVDFAWHEGIWNAGEGLIGKIPEKDFEKIYYKNAEKFYGLKKSVN